MRSQRGPIAQEIVAAAGSRLVQLAGVILLVAVGVGSLASSSGSRAAARPVVWEAAAPPLPSAAATAAPAVGLAAGTAVGPSPAISRAMRLPGAGAALPPVPPGVAFRGHLLITDRENLRIVEIDPSGDVTWSFPRPDDPEALAYGSWDDANYGLDGSTIYANSDPTSTVIAIDVATRSVKWHAGTPHKPGRGDDAFAGPDDIVPMLDGSVVFADIRNCRIVRLAAEDGRFLSSLGDGRCAHKPPARFSSPNAAYDAGDGDLVVTEIGGEWIDRIGPDGTVRWAFRSPAKYPSDAIPEPDGTVLLADYVSPGRVMRLAPDGTVRWSYDAGGTLQSPSSVVPLASNRVAISDDFGDRVLIVDPTTNEIVRELHQAGGLRFHWIDCVAFRPD